MGVIGESSVILIQSVNQPFGALAQGFSPVVGFRTSPPERIGVRGEYDYNGLARRVEQCFQLNCAEEDLSQLRVRQRGCVVILTGAVSSQAVLNEMVNLAIDVEGTALVEVYDVCITSETVAA